MDFSSCPQKYTKRLDKIDDLVMKYYQYIETSLAEEFKNLLKKGGTAEVVMERLYNYEEWNNTIKDITGQRSLFLKNIKEIWGNEIADLEKLYPAHNFKSVSIQKVFEELSKITEVGDLFDLATIGKNEITVKIMAAGMTFVTGNIPRIVEFYQNQLGGTLGRIKTEIFTMQGILFNKLRTNFFKSIPTAGQKKYIYIGVVDGKTREFCRQHVGVIKSESAWKNTDNKQTGTAGGNAFDKLGGWNCRHMMLLMPEEKNILKELGYGKSK